MADDKISKKRGRAPVVPLVVPAAPAQRAASPMIVPEPTPIVIPTVKPAPPAHIAKIDTAPAEAAPLPAASIEPVPTRPALAEPVIVASPQPEPAMTTSVMLEPAPADAVAISPSSDPEPAPDDVSAPAAPSSKGLIEMATAFQPAPEAAEKAKAIFGDINVRAKSAMEKSVKLGEEMTELTKGNVEALIQSSRVAAKGAESLAQDAAETMKKNFESASATMKSFASVKSPTELFQLQSEAAKSYFDSAVADMSKFTEQMMKLAGDVAQPLSSRYSVAMEKVKATAL